MKHKDMNPRRDDQDDIEELQPLDRDEDNRLKHALARWVAPPVSSSTDDRIIAMYRKQVGPGRWWKRILTASIAVPAPVAVASALLVMVLGLLLVQSQRQIAAANPQPAPAPVVKIVEVPVVQVKTVTRIVYVERKLRLVAQTETASGDRNQGGLNVAYDGLGNEIRGPGQAQLKDFQPPQEMKIRVIKRGDSNED